MTLQSNERNVREILCSKLSGTHLGLWLLIPEYLRLGVWDLLKGVFAKPSAGDIYPRMAMQLVNESALCVNRIRPRGSLCNQGFALANGLSFLAADETVHELLDMNSVATYENMQIALLQIRNIGKHYDRHHVFALDPHRIPSATQRTMPCKKKQPDLPAQKMLQTFFCVDAYSGQPLAFNLGSAGKNCSPASMQLLSMIERSGIKDALFVADKEHFTQEIVNWFYHHPHYDILMPLPDTPKTINQLASLQYKPCWPGFALACTTFRFENNPQDFRMIAQRQGEQPSQYQYKAFLTTSSKNITELVTEHYRERWSIEEFFNFEGEMGWNRASTFNLNIRYGKQSLAMIAQAAAHQLKNKLPETYKTWTAQHTASEVFTNMEGDVRVKDDTIIVTYYRDHEKLNLKQKLENLPNILEVEGVNPKIPWLFDFKLNFRFK